MASRLIVPFWLVQALLVSAVAMVSYLHSCWAGFVFDDNEAILSNKDIRTDTPLFNVFKNDFWGASVLSNTSHKSYRPLTILTFRVNYWFGGMNPFGYHLANLLLHTLVCLVFLRVCECLWKDVQLITTPEVESNKNQWWDVLFAALLFASHPIHTETVAGVVGRAELISAVCFFLALLVHRLTCYYSKKTSIGKVLLCLLLTAVLAGSAMLFKEQGVTAIGVCIVYDCILMGIDPRQLLKQKIPNHTKRKWVFFLTRLSSLLVFGLLLMTLRMLTGAPTFHPIDNPASFHNSTFIRILNYNYLYSLNSWLLVHPWWLCFDWSMGCVPLITSLSDMRLLAVAVFWVFLLSLALYCVLAKPSSTKRLVTIALVLLVVPFLPASNLLVRVGFVLAERVLYLPSAGFCIVVSMGATLLSRHLGKQLYVAMSTFVILTFVIRSVNRTSEWLSEESLFTSAIKVCPLNAKVLYNIGKVSLEKGDTEIGEAAYREAIRLYPNYDQALNNYGNLLKDTGRYVEAENALKRAVTVNPKFAAGWMNLGIVQAALNKTKEAENSYVSAVRYRRKYPDAYYNLGNMYIDTGRFGKAIVAFKEAIQLQNDHVNARSNLALLYENMDMFEEAENLLRESIAKLPDSPHFHYALGVVMGKLKRFKEGEKLLLKAVEMDPESAKYHTNLGVIYHFQNNYFLAKQHYKRALAIDPTMAAARDNLKKLIRTTPDN